MSQLSPLRSFQRRAHKLIVAVPVLSLWTGVTLCSCVAHPPAESPEPPVPSAPASSVQAPAPAPVLPKLTAQEQALETELRSETDSLMALGNRASNSWSLADATDHLASRLEGYGYEVKRRGFSWGEAVAQNLEVEVPGLRRGDEVIVVTARLDSNPESPGADDNASGVAALLSLARHFYGQRRLRTLRFLWLSSAGPRPEKEAQGAFGYVRQLDTAKTKVVASIELYGLGHFSEVAGSQDYPAGVVADTRRAGDFMALISHPEDNLIAEKTGSVLKQSTSLPVHQWVLLKSDKLLEGSSHLAFSSAGYPSLLLTDTQALRSAAGEFGTKNDIASGLDYPRMARVTAGMIQTLERLAGPPGQANIANAKDKATDAQSGGVKDSLMNTLPAARSEAEIQRQAPDRDSAKPSQRGPSVAE